MIYNECREKQAATSPGSKARKPEGVSIHRQNKMFSRNLSVPDFMRRFFISCTQISEAYAVRTVMKFGCDWRKTGHKSRCMKDSERTLNQKGITLPCLPLHHRKARK